MLSSLILKLIICCQIYFIVVEAKQLKLVHAIWRHGIRSPLYTFPTDFNNSESTWPQGLGQLTPMGIQQQYELGQYLKQRYRNFLSESYDPKQIYIRSINEDRMISSAEANLAGMYPPIDKEIWNKSLMWQPIPVHTVLKDTDATLWMSAPCPLASQLTTEVEKSDAWKKYNDENKDFFEFLSNQTGIPSVKMQNCGHILDPLCCDYFNSRKWPDWVNHTIYNKLANLADISPTFYFQIQQFRRLRGALLFHEIAARMKQSSLNRTEQLKYYAYSASDATLIALLFNFNVYDGSWPLFSNVLLIEMYKVEDQFLVEVYKRNGTSEADVYKIVLPTCKPCTVDKFLSLAESNRPLDWWQECQTTKDSE